MRATLALTGLFLTALCHAAAWQAIIPDADAEAWRAVAADWLQAAGQPAPTVRSASAFLSSRPALSPDTRLMIFGHAGINPLLARWYGRGLDSTDLEYPGPGGYVLRPLAWTEETPSAVIIAGAATAADLQPAKEAFVRLTQSPMPTLVVKLGGKWPEVVAKEKQWWQTLAALPVLGDRQDAEHMRWYFSAQMQPLAQPEVTTWAIWMQRMIALANRAAEGVHATGDPDAQALMKRVLQNLVAHLPPAETCEPGQKSPKDWMGEYYWPVLMYSLLQTRSFVESDADLAQVVDRTINATTAA